MVLGWTIQEDNGVGTEILQLEEPNCNSETVVLICTECPFTFAEKTELEAHVQELHFRLCTLCNEAYISMNSL